MFAEKKYDFSVEEMKRMEAALRGSALGTLRAGDPTLMRRLGLQIQYVRDMPADIEAALLPASEAEHNGLIILRSGLEKNPFAAAHEIIHAVFDAGAGCRVEDTYLRGRMSLWPTETPKTRRTNYLAAAFVMPCERIEEKLEAYERARFETQELAFIRQLQHEYRQSETAVIRRVAQVRRLRRTAD